jgi:serine/threonine-protein kinase
MEPNDSPQQWGRIECLFHEAVALSGDERRAFLDRVCAGDPDLRREVEDLLRSDAATEGFDAADQRPHEALLEAMRDPAARVGARVGPFVLQQLVGAGGMGTVWLASRADRDFEQRVAVKLIKRGMDTDDVLRRFRRERQVLARLEHPHIARLLDGGAAEDGRPYLAMEFIEGEPITEFCQREQLALKDRLRLFVRVCEGVQFAHQNLIIHRDLKPSNILVATGGTPKLLDFGIAKILRDDEGDSPVTTASDSRLLTPRYASPEQVRFERVTTATDTYSLGVILYELLTGTEPYQLTTRSRVEYERAICEQDPVRPSAVLTAFAATRSDGATAIGSSRPYDSLRKRQQRQLTGDLDTIVLKALRKNPVERYPTVQQFIDDLERFLSGRPVLARRQTLRYHAAKFVARNKAAVGAGVAVLAVLAIASVVSVTFAIREARQRSLAEQRLIEAEQQAAIAQAINKFINEDLLASVDPDRTPDREVTMRRVLDLAAERIGDRFHDQPVVEASILATLGMTYESLGEYEAAHAPLTRAFELLVDATGERSEPAIRARAALGDLKRSQANLAEAEPLIVSASDMARSTLPPKHPTTLFANRCLGELYIDQGLLQQAIDVLEETAKGYESALGAGAKETLNALNSLGVAYDQAGRNDDAERVHAELLNRKMELFGPDNFGTITTLNNLAFTRMNLGRFEEAEADFRSAQERARRVLGDTHPTTLTTLDNLGLLCTHRGRFEEAQALHQEAYEARVRTLGPEHWDTLTSLSNLGFAQINAQQFEKAEAALSALLPRVQRVSGVEHHHAITAQNNLAYVVWKLGRLEEARKRFEEVLELRQRILGPDHPETFGTCSNLAGVLIDLGRFTEADSIAEDALARAERTLSENHPVKGSLLHKRGICFLRFGQLETAKAHLTRARGIYESSFGAEHSRVREVDVTLAELGGALAKQDPPPLAAPQ